MGVIYKLKDEVVNYIIIQRQGNPLVSCRQLAESASREFGLNLSKSSVHEVLKESGINSPRGRKPKNKFTIPQEKKKQIQESLSKINLLPAPEVPKQEFLVKIEPVIPNEAVTPSNPVILSEAGIHVETVILSVAKDLNISKLPQQDTVEKKQEMEDSSVYEGAGKIFLKAAYWDLGVFEQEEIKESDRFYFLTYSKGVRIRLENGTEIFIDLPLPIERCIREVADGLINNIKPFIVHNASDELLFKACMDAQEGYRINNISIVDASDHILFELSDIVEYNRLYYVRNRTFVVNNEINQIKRAKSLFFTQSIDINELTNNIINFQGFNTSNHNEITVSLIIEDNYDKKPILLQAMERLNGMYLRDELDRAVKVKIES